MSLSSLKSAVRPPVDERMYTIHFDNPVHIHFIGIGGISMSGLAAVLLKENFTVSGSDVKESSLTERLEKDGAKIRIGQCAENITDDIDVVVYTAAIHPDNPELARAAEKNIPLLTRAELLGQLMKNYKIPVAVAGTHGKTTTTSMAAHILLAADLDPTISVGGMLPAIGGNIRTGKGDVLLAEACEYTNSFLSFFPKIGIILNVDADHLDFFKDLDDIRSSFRKFAQLLPEDGTLIINADDPSCGIITAGLPCRILTYSTKGAGDFSAEEITFNEQGCASFVIRGPEGSVVPVSLSIPGVHNVANALAAAAMAYALGIGKEALQEGLRSFGGTQRRFEYKGDLNGITVIDDYAHHPTEIKATLATAENYPHRTIWCEFQPHTYTRAKALLNELAEALSRTDRVILADIYAAREKDEYGVSSETLQKRIQDLGTQCWYFPSFEEIEDFLLENCREGDLILTMGAGNVVRIGEELLQRGTL